MGLPPAHSDADIRTAVKAATRAPSSHNTQPWRFEIAGSRIRLFADRTRRLPANDPDDRELTISCGCALFNLRSSLAQAGHGPRVEEIPDPGSPDLLAEVQALDGAQPDPRLAGLAAMIGRRYSTRQPFAAGQVPAPTLAALGEAVDAEGAWMHVIDGASERGRLAELVRRADRSQWSDVGWRRELAHWMRSRGGDDGLGVPALIGPLVRFVVRRSDFGSRVAASDVALVREAPALLVIGTREDRERDWLRVGQALQRVLLTACADGYQAGYLNQVIQVPEIREELADLIACQGRPQLVLRMGQAKHPGPVSPRRSVEEVTDGLPGRPA